MPGVSRDSENLEENLQSVEALVSWLKKTRPGLAQALIE